MKIKRGKEIAVVTVIVLLVIVIYFAPGREFAGKAISIVNTDCGKNITQDADLTADLDGGFFGCANDGLNIVAPNVVLDCKGYKIYGVNTAGSQGLNVNASNVTIQNCEIYAFESGIFGVNADNIIIKNTIVHDNNYNNILLDSSDNAHLDNNTVYKAKADHGFSLHSSTHALIENSLIYDNKIYGILMNASTYSTIQNNIIVNCTLDSLATGIYFERNANYNNITNNQINNNRFGIGLDNSKYNNFIKNTINNNLDTGILPFSNSDYNLIYNNSLRGNGWNTGGNYRAGFMDYISNNNTLDSNTIAANYIGIILRGAADDLIKNNWIVNQSSNGIQIADATGYNIPSKNNLIFNNYIANNFAGNALDQSTLGNIWNTQKTTGTNIIGGPSLGGNSWGGYTGVDTDFDGFGEAPYTTGIQVGVGDLLPLVTYTPPPPGPNITITKTAHTNLTHNGTYLNYTITISNTGNGSAEEVIVIETSPTSTIYWAASPGPTTEPNPGNITWNISSILNHTTITINITVYINESFTGNITNLVNITYEDDLNNTFSKTAQETTEVLPSTTTPPSPPPSLINITGCGNNLNTNGVLNQDIEFSEGDDSYEFCINVTADNITIDCNGHTIAGPGFDDSNSMYYAIGIVNRNNVTVRNCRIVDSTFGISVDYSQDILIESNIFHNNGPAIWTYFSDNNLIKNNLIDNMSGAFEDSEMASIGVMIMSSDNNLIQNNSVSNYNIAFVSIPDEEELNQNNIFDSNFVSDNNYIDILFAYANDTIKDMDSFTYEFYDSLLALEKTGVGKIQFTDFIDSNFDNPINISDVIQMTQNKIFVNTSTDSGFIVPAIITLNNIQFIDPKPQVDINDNGQFADCPASRCTEISYSGGNYVFSVTNFTTYRTTEAITGQPSLIVTKSDTPDPVLNNTYLNYTVTIQNTGTAPAGSVQLVEMYPVGVKGLVSSIPTPSSGNNIWNIGTLNNGTTFTIRITTLVDQNVTNNSNLVNTANVSYYNGTGTIYLTAQSTTKAYVGEIPTAPPPPPPPIISSGGGRGRGGSHSFRPPCQQVWQCSSWSACTNNQQTRTCVDANNCAELFDSYQSVAKPAETQACDITPTATCTDSIKNQGESDIDCGGPCSACSEGKRCFSDINCQTQNCLRGLCVAAETECLASLDCNVGYECVLNKCQAVIVERAPSSFLPMLLVAMAVIIVGFASVTGSIIGGIYVKHLIIAKDLNKKLAEAGRLATAKNRPGLRRKYLEILSDYKKLPEKEKHRFYSQINRLYTDIKKAK